MKEWKTYKLSEIGQVIGGATPSTKVASNYDGDIAWITPKDLSLLSGRYIYKGERSITEAGYKSCSCQMLPAGSILFSSRAPIGYIAIAGNDLCTNQGFKSVVPNPEIVNSHFLYYLLSYEKNRIAEMGSGTTFMEISGNVMKNIEVKLPHLSIQNKIAEILTSLDEKIENNQRINDNLEQQLKLLYRSWFIENKHPDSKEVCLSEIIYFQEGPGIRNWQYVEKDGIKFINIRCIEGGDINLTTANMISEEEANGKYAHFMLKPFDIIMSCSGTLGRYAIVRKEHLPLCLNTSVIRFSPNRSESDYSYIYGYLASEEFLNKQVEMACGSVQANFGPTHLKQIKIIAPPIDYCKSYHTAAMPIISKILENRREIQHLGKLRDTLLPKLMSGELKINELDC